MLFLIGVTLRCFVQLNHAFIFEFLKCGYLFAPFDLCIFFFSVGSLYEFDIFTRIHVLDE